MKRIAWAAALLPILAVLAGCGSSGSKESEGLDTSFRPPASYSLPQLDQQRYPCGKENERVRDLVPGKLTTRYGPQASLGVVDTVETAGKIDPTFDTHQLAHLVGEATAKTVRREQAGVRALPADVQLRLRPRVLHLRARPQRVTDQGGEDDLRLGWPGPLVPTFNCWHGVGHGVMMARGNDLQRLARRLRLARERERRGRLLAGRVHGEHQRRLPRPGAAGRVLAGAPAPPMHARAGRVQAGVLHQPGGLARASGQRRHRQGSALLPGRGEYVSACAQSIGLMVTNPSWQLPFYGSAKGASFEQIAWDLCSRFPAKLQRDCVLGGVDNLANFDQLNVKRSDGFCALTGRLQKTCYREIGVNLIRRTTDAAVANARCNELSSHQARTASPASRRDSFPPRRSRCRPRNPSSSLRRRRASRARPCA